MMQKILIGIFLCSFIEASEYIFSYRVAVENGIVLSEKYYFSPAMVNAETLNKVKNPYKQCEIVHNAKSEKEFLRYSKEDILECFFKWGVKLEDRSTASDYKGAYISFLSIPATRIKIEYESGIAKIYHLMANTKEQR